MQQYAGGNPCYLLGFLARKRYNKKPTTTINRAARDHATLKKNHTKSHKNNFQDKINYSIRSTPYDVSISNIKSGTAAAASQAVAKPGIER